jgi:hypothetical protein
MTGTCPVCAALAADDVAQLAALQAAAPAVFEAGMVSGIALATVVAEFVIRESLCAKHDRGRAQIARAIAARALSGVAPPETH